MMRCLASSSLKWFLAGVFGAVSLFGSGLHYIPGMGHGGSGCGHSHAGDFSRSVFAAQQWQGCHFAAVNHTEGCDNDSQCPICQYMAQGKVLGERFEPNSVPTLVARRAVLAPLAVASAVLQAFQARGPPAA
jgi:hypothetical protein